MITRFPLRTGLLSLVAVAALTAGCASHREKAGKADSPFAGGPAGTVTPQSEQELRLEADQAYRKAHAALDTADYQTAISRFSELIARYPFSDYATQAELEKIYAQYHSFQPDETVLAADRFLREHPRYPNADYVQYIKGLTDSGRDQSLLDYLPLDRSKRDASNSRRAYDDFALLLQKYPDSRYAGDARKRMIALRNRVASHELSVTRYYIKRGAWVAAAKRAEDIIAQYPGAPATADALVLLKQCTDKLGEKQQSAEVARLIDANAASLRAAKLEPAKPEARSVVSAPASANAAVAAGDSAAPAASKGFFGRIGGLLDSLNKTYTVGGDAAQTNPGATAAAGSNAAAHAAESSGSASLSTGPYSGPDTVIDISPAKPPAPAAAAADGTAASAATATEAASPKKKNGGWFDFLNKTYTIGGPDKAKAETNAEAAPATTSDAPAPPAAPLPAAATATPASAPAATPETAASTAPAAATATAPAEETPKKKTGGWFDFLNKTYVIGGSHKKPAETPKAEAADTPAPAANSPAVDAETGGKSGSGFRVYLDYEKAATDDGDQSADKKPAEPAPAAPAPIAEPAK